MSYHYWEYFLSIEDDLVRTARYVEFHRSNYPVYSIEFARILLASSSEVDVVTKLLYPPQINSRGEDRRNIADHRQNVTTLFPNLLTMEISIPRYGLLFNPWNEWLASNSPSWWTSYTEVKHQRDQFYNKATLESTLNSVAGLLCVVLYYYQKVKNTSRLYPPPRLFEPKWYEQDIHPATSYWEFTLPD